MYRHIHDNIWRSGIYGGFTFTHSQLKNNLTKLFYFYGERNATTTENANIFALKINNSLIEIQYCIYNSICLLNNFSGWQITFNQNAEIISFDNPNYTAPQNGKLIVLFV